jgi:hypothetical protein
MFLEEFRFEVAQLLHHQTLRGSDDSGQMTAGFSAYASLQIPTLVGVITLQSTTLRPISF